MTRLLGGAIGAIAFAAAFLLLGWLGANELFIWLSILSSVGAAVCLAMAFAQSRATTSAPSQRVVRKRRS